MAHVASVRLHSLEHAGMERLHSLEHTLEHAVDASLPPSAPRWPLFTFLFGACACLFLSAMCHTFGCVSARVNAWIWKLDYVGIALLIACSFFNFSFSFSHLSMLKPLPSVIRQEEEEEEKFLESPSDILVGKRFFFLVFRLKRKGVKSKQKILKNERNEHCMKLNKNRKPSLNRNYFSHLFFFSSI